MKTFSALNRLSLRIEDCRGQGYDGAAAMSSIKVGLRARVQSVVGTAVYTHCFAHKLNLCLKDGIANIHQDRIKSELEGAFDTIRKKSKFVRDNPQRMAALQSFIDESPITASARLGPICPTRWSLRSAAVDSLLKAYEPCLNWLESCKDKIMLNISFRSNAKSILSNMENFTFYFCLRMFSQVFSLTTPIHLKLQNKECTISGARELVTGIKETQELDPKSVGI